MIDFWPVYRRCSIEMFRVEILFKVSIFCLSLTLNTKTKASLQVIDNLIQQLMPFPMRRPSWMVLLAAKKRVRMCLMVPNIPWLQGDLDKSPHQSMKSLIRCKCHNLVLIFLRFLVLLYFVGPDSTTSRFRNNQTSLFHKMGREISSE